MSPSDPIANQHGARRVDDAPFTWPSDAAEEEEKITSIRLTVEYVADETEKAFRERVRWWGGG